MIFTQDFWRGFWFLPISWGTWLRELTHYYDWVFYVRRPKEMLKWMGR